MFYNLSCTKKRRIGLTRHSKQELVNNQYSETLSIKSDLTLYFIRPYPSSYIPRLQDELELIHMNAFETIFIQVIEILQLYKKQYPNYPHIIRGSAASSLVSYLVGITDIDPVQHGMCLSRFMNKKRKNKPDIDVDFPQHIRDTFLSFLFQHYEGRIARISNHVHWRERSIQREKQRSGQEHSVGDFRHYSTHCGGVVISSQFNQQEMLAYDKHKVQLKYDKVQTEQAGYMKIDLLSNRGLSILYAIQEMLQEFRPLTEYPKTDRNIETCFATGNVIGITYCETPAMTHIIQLIQPKSPEELAYCLAMVRPAADHKAIKPIILNNVDQIQLDKLKQQDLFSMMVYDDDVVQYLQQELDMDETDAETLRKRCSKNEQDAYNYIVNAKGQAVADRIMEVSNKYSFCKSHAMSYAYLGWALAYHKVYHPIEFWCAVLNHAQSMYPPWVYVRYAIGQTGYRIQEHVLSVKTSWKVDKKYKVFYKTCKYQQGKLAYKYNEQDILKNIEQYGYWHEPEFIQDCFYIDETRYRGLVCCKRKVQGIQFVSFMISNTEMKHVVCNSVVISQMILNI